MPITTANCPSCGAPITFKLGASIVVICDYCNSAIARTDRDVRNLGKVADLVDTRSPLTVGTEGRFEGVSFVLTGRAQISHPAGGVWDEWYATFTDGRTGWLAEAQGRFYLTFPVAVPDPRVLPQLSQLRPGVRGPLPGSPVSFAVNEVGSARPMSAEGEIPYELVPNQEYYYADLSGERGAFATVDYSETPPLLFLGREVTLDGLGIHGEADELSTTVKKVGAVRLTCPHCGGPMDLRMPDSERATCPNCNALLDVNQGNLTYLKTLQQSARPLIPLGAKGTFDEGELTVVGYMTRHCVVGGIAYAWEEYLLYAPRIGFRWLVQDSGHWAYVTPINPGDVFDGDSIANYGGRQFKQFQAAAAHVDSVYGEFYWKVSVGETTWAKDFVRPPEILSKEGSAGEINWSYGVYVPRERIAEIFKISSMPQQKVAVGMAQPNPFVGKVRPWLVLLLVGFIVGMIVQLSGSNTQVYSKIYNLEAVDSAQGTRVIFTDPIHLDSHKNIRVSMQAPVDNSWVYVEGDFVDEQSGLVQNFSNEISYYHGYEGGESWSEGSTQSKTYISALPAGEYTLRLEAQWEHWQQPMRLSVTVDEGVPRFLHFMILMGLLSLGPIIILLRRTSFERRRWSESMFNPYASSDD